MTYKAGTQNELVDQFLANTDKGREVTDKIFVPDLSTFFYKLPLVSKTKMKKNLLKLNGLNLLHTRTRMEITEALIKAVGYYPGTVAISWVAGEDHIDVDYVDGFQQKVLDKERLEILSQAVVNVIKSRQNVKAVKWSLGTDYIDVTYFVA